MQAKILNVSSLNTKYLAFRISMSSRLLVVIDLVNPNGPPSFFLHTTFHATPNTMHLKSTLCAILLVCTVLARAQEDNDNISEPMSADPVAFLRVGRGRYISITSTQYEAIERDGETPPLVAEDVPETPTGISATALSSDEQNAILKAHNDFRALHGSPALTWNDNAAAFGNNWIQACNFAHSHGRVSER